ncbi:YheC/YheD family protein [Bacillus tuaregi]|uniref:YheC/YheD family protein n=1 Tax=Bacillus tuaregi TaxID=1816695 RepID=UPI0008F83DB3|nr:YheC/YheD family protein [Bacillus tuaregi]
MSSDKQLFQLVRIMDTMLEAIEHFSVLVKERNFNKYVFIFSSIVDGFGAIKKGMNLYSEFEGQKEIEGIEYTLYTIAKDMEIGNSIKMSELVRFSLVPQILKLKKGLERIIDNGPNNQKVTIGVYFCENNPLKVYPKERINSLIKEGERQGANVLFFSSNDIDFEKRQVTADTFIDGKWKRIKSPFPDVINNIGVKSRSQQSRKERKLRQEVPFTSFGVGNKFYLPKKIVESRKYADLLVPFKVVTDESIIHKFFIDNKSAVFKSLLGNRGENIYFVNKIGNRYLLMEHKKKRTLNQMEFEKWVYDIILKQKNSYIVQQYIHCRTRDGEPYDIRAHVQKDGNGKWTLTKIYPRIGNKKSNLSNISRGGRTERLENLLAKEFGNKGKEYEERLKNLAMDLTWHLDKLHGLALNELGLDLAIDENGCLWLHEVNNGPQSTYHEDERAINTIAYAIYIAKNRIFHTNEFDRKIKVRGQFDAENTDLQFANLDNRIRIGMLASQNDINDLAVACAYVANYENVNFYYFTSEDIDYDEMLIRGYFYENKEWVPKIVEYPDVIYDRLRLRGIKGYNIVYEELEGIPFTNEFFGNSISKLDVYDRLKSTGKIDDVIIPYQKVNRVKDIFNYIGKYGKIILKPEIGSFANGVHFIERNKTDDYFVAIGEREYHYSELQLNQYLRDLMRKSVFIVQKYIETRTKEGKPFDIRVHMMKDGNGNWSFVNNYPRIGIHHAVISSTGNGGYIGGIVGFLKRNFSEERGKEIINEIETTALKVASTFEGFYEKNLSEMGLDIAIGKDMKPYIIEVNVNKPGIVYYEFEVAKHAIPYAIYLANNEKTKLLDSEKSVVLL